MVLKFTLASLSTKTRLGLLPSWDDLPALSALFVPYPDDSGFNPTFLDKVDESQLLSAFYRSLLRIIFVYRCFFITRSGRTGIGPDDIDSSTLVCVVDGNDYLFLLNQVTSDLKPDNRYKLLKLGYVRGLVFGEGLHDGSGYQRIEIE